jgi:hypothetical protein
MKMLNNISLPGLKLGSRQPGNTLLGLAFDGSQLEVVEARRTNGSVEIVHSFTTTLSLDVLSNAPELVGREIRKVLDEHEIRERWCAVCLPLNWALTLTVPLPDLPETDLASFLQVEAERGFPYAQDALLMATSRYQTGEGQRHATLIAMPRNHVSRLESVLEAALLRPASFSLGIAAMVPAEKESSDGVLALVPGIDHIRMQLTLGGGIALLRTIEGAFDLAGAERQLQADHVLREMRITLGQMAPEIRTRLKRVVVVGNSEDAEELVETLEARVRDQGLELTHVRKPEKGSLPLNTPDNAVLSPALALAVCRLASKEMALEFLPPKISAWQQLSSKYSSPRLMTVGVGVGGVAAAVLLAFFVQQTMLWYWGARWNRIMDRTYTLEETQVNIRNYRGWYDGSIRELSILRSLTECFPQEGGVSLKQVEIRDATKPGELPVVTCVGTAKDRGSWHRVRDKLGKSRNVLNIGTKKEDGDSPVEFEFSFNWTGGGA